MPDFVVLTESPQRETLRTATTAVVCGAPAKVREVVGAASLSGSQTTFLHTAAEMRQFADGHSSPDVCVIVTPLPDGPAIPLIRVLRARGWQKIVVLSGKADARAIHSTLVAGVRSVIVHREAEVDQATTPRGSAILSERELEVLRMVADGQTNRAVGDQLGLSALTVKSHLARIARKLGCGDRAEMVATAIRGGYIA